MLWPASARAGLTAEDLMNMPLDKLVQVEVLVTGASKYAEKVSEAPSIVEIITADDIRTYGYRTLGDAINALHGIYISSDRNYTTLGVRGFLFTGYSNSRILIMVDGRRMNENVYDAAYLGEEFLVDMALIDHIEYIPGPGSSIYGANAMMGVVNVVTKKGSDIGAAQVEVKAGSLRTGSVRGTFGKQLEGGADVLVSASGFGTKGDENLYLVDFDNPAENNGIAHDLDAERSRRLFAKVEKGNFTVQAGYHDRGKEVPTAPYASLFNEQGNKTFDQQAYGEVRYNRALNDKTSLDLKTFYHWYASNLDYPYDFFGTYILFSRYTGNWAGAEATLVSTHFDGHKIVVGGEFQYDFNQKLLDHDDFFVYQDTNRSGLRTGLYIQDAWSITDKLTLSAGLRLDTHHMINEPQINPRLGLIWNPKPSTTFKLLYGSAFRAPNVYERDYDAFFAWAGNPYNKEEKIKNYEAAAEWRGNGWKVSGSVFYNDFQDVLSKDYDFTAPTYHMYVNYGHLRSAGFDVNAQKKWDNGRELKLNFNHTEYLEYSGTAWSAVDDPKNVFKISYVEPFVDGRYKLAFENIFVGERTNLYYYTTDSYNVVNANLFAPQLLPGLDGAVSIYNLFDHEHDMIGGGFVRSEDIPMRGRTVLFSLQKTF